MTIWKPIEEFKFEKRGKFYILCAVLRTAGSTTYITDPYCGFKLSADDTWARWPHHSPPTHFAEIDLLTL